MYELQICCYDMTFITSAWGILSFFVRMCVCLGSVSS